MWRNTFIYLLLLTFLLLPSCAEYTPKPRGYFRIEPPAPRYVTIPVDEYPFSFRISSLVTIEMPLAGDPLGWINLSYPSLQAKIYCTAFPIIPAGLHTAMEESRTLVVRQSKGAGRIKEQAFENPDEKVYASLFLLDGDAASPIQFTITDSVSRFFRGSLLYNTTVNADSLAPVTQYLQADIVELIQSFSWKK